MTLDQVYEVQHTALDSDVQATHGPHPEPVRRRRGPSSLVRVAKAVALLELIQDVGRPTRSSSRSASTTASTAATRWLPITEALEDLRRRNLLGYSEKHGYKIQSSAGEEWERERRDIGVAREEISDTRPGRAYLPPRLPGPPATSRAVISLGGAYSPTADGSRTSVSSTRATTRPSGSTSVSWPARSAPRAPG